MIQKKLTKDELNLLLYLETRAVDYKGIIDTRHLNPNDFEIANGWDSKGCFVSFKRYTQRGTGGEILQLTYRVQLFDEAWLAVHQERKARAARNYDL